MGKFEKIKYLAQKVYNNDESAFNELYNMLWKRLYVFAQSMLMDESVSKDIVQEVWIDYWNRRRNIKNTNIKSYLYQSVRNEVYKHLRKKAFNAVHLTSIEELPNTITPYDETNHEKITHRIKQAVRDLPKRNREIFELNWFQGLDNEEIANYYHIKKHSVENQLSIALKKIRKNLKEVYTFFL